jgi:hypothetical protein
VNPAFERHNGLVQATGKRIRELTPGIEAKWLRFMGRWRSREKRFGLRSLPRRSIAGLICMRSGWENLGSTKWRCCLRTSRRGSKRKQSWPIPGGTGAIGGGADGEAAGVGGGAGAFLLHDHARFESAFAGDAGVCGNGRAGVRGSEAKPFLEKISTAAERMDGLIADALSYSRSVRQELPLEDVDAGALLRGILDSYPQFQPWKAQIRVEGRCRWCWPTRRG